MKSQNGPRTELWMVAYEAVLGRGGTPWRLGRRHRTRALALRARAPCVLPRGYSVKLSRDLGLPTLSAAQRKHLLACWQPLRAVCAALGVPFCWGTRASNEARIRLGECALSLWRTLAFRGEDFLTRKLKLAAAQARLVVITGDQPGPELRWLLRRLPSSFTGRRQLEQLSYLGRALPVGGELVKERALAQHKEVLSTEFCTPPEILSRAYYYARDLATRLNLKGLDETLTTAPTATTSSSRRAGGLRSDLRASSNTWLSSLTEEERRYAGPVFGRQSNVAKLGDATHWATDPWSVVSREDLISGPPAIARSAAVDIASCGPHSVVALPERGWKARVLTKPPPQPAVAGNVLNKALLSFLRREPRCAKFLAGDRRAAVETAVKGWAKIGGLREVVSTDLTAASDRLPLDLVTEIVEGLIAGWKGLPAIWARALRTLTGPQALLYPDGERLRTARGLLMGLGPTWPVMSVIHLFWVDTAAILEGSPRAARLARDATAIGGDDLVGIWSPSLASCYRSVVASCGGKFSDGKVYFARDAGNFTEMSFFLRARGQSPKWAAGIPVKGLVGCDLQEIGAAFEALGRDSGRVLRGRRVLNALYPGAWGSFAKLGIPPAWPRSLGGAGLPCRRGSPLRVSAPFRVRLAVGKFLYGQDPKSHPPAPPAWSECDDATTLASREAALSRIRRILSGAEPIKFGPFPSRARLVLDAKSSRPRGPLSFEIGLEDLLSSLTARETVRTTISGRGKIKGILSGTRAVVSFRDAVRRWTDRTLGVGNLPTALAVASGPGRRSGRIRGRLVDRAASRRASVKLKLGR
nr:MAG: RNA-dependent RNA polymerase [brine shrimp narna-like virus 1]